MDERIMMTEVNTDYTDPDKYTRDIYCAGMSDGMDILIAMLEDIIPIYGKLITDAIREVKPAVVDKVRKNMKIVRGGMDGSDKQ